MKRRLLLVSAAGLALLAAGCGKKADNEPVVTARSTNACAYNNLTLRQAGRLTVATGNPAHSPWFSGGTKPGSTWKVNDPSTGRGFESAVTYAVAKALGFTPAQVRWTQVTRDRALAPGDKPFDLAVDQLLFSDLRATAVDFSSSYYDVNQAVLTRKGEPIATAGTLAALKPYKLGALAGSSGKDAIASKIGPDSAPTVFPSAAAGAAALKSGRIDGLLVDLPTAFLDTEGRVPNSKVVGQLPATSGEDHFGFVLRKGNGLTPCIDKALAKLHADGTLAQIQQQWLANATGAPILK